MTWKSLNSDGNKNESKDTKTIASQADKRNEWWKFFGHLSIKLKMMKRLGQPPYNQRFC